MRSAHAIGQRTRDIGVRLALGERQLVFEGKMDHAIGVDRRFAEAMEVVERAATNVGAGGRLGRG